MASIADLFVNIGADISDFKKQMSDMQKNLKGIGDGMKSAGKKLTTGLTVPLAGLGAASVMTYATFEQSMNKVAAISGATGSELSSLTDLAKHLGSTTKFSASEAADGMSYLAMAGFDVNEIIGAMPGMLDLAAASGMDLATTADIASNILTGFGLDAGEAARVADVLAAASSSANTDVSQLGTAMAYVAPVAAGAGISLEETSAAIGMLSDAGIQGSRAGTTLTGVISSLQNPVGEAKKVMEELGLSMEDLDPSTQSLADIMKTLEAAGMDSAQAVRFFGREAGPGMTALLSQGSDKLISFTDDLENSKDSAKNMADIMNGGLSGAFTELSSALEGAAIEFGEVLAPVVMKVTEGLTELVRWFGALSPEIKVVIAVVAAIVSALGPLLVIAGMVVGAISNLTPVFAAVGTAISGATIPIWPIIAAIAALIAIGVLLYQNWDTIKEYAMVVWEAIWSFMQPIVEAIGTFIMDKFNLVRDWWLELWPQLQEALLNVWNNLLAYIMPAVEAIVSFITEKFEQVKTWWNELWPQLQEQFANIWNWVIEFITPIIDTIVSIFQASIPVIISIFSGLWSAITAITQGIVSVFQWAWPFVESLIVSVWGNIKGIIDGALNIIMGIVGVFANLFTGNWSGLWDSIKQILSGALTLLWNLIQVWAVGRVLKLFGTFMKSAANVFKSGWNVVKNIFTTVTNVIKNVVTTIFNAIRSVITTVMGAIRSVITSILNVIRSIFSSVFNAVRSVATSVFNAIRSVITSVMNTVRSIITSVLNGIRNTFSNIFNAVRNVVSNAINGVKNTISNGIKGALNIVKNLGTSFKNAGKGLIDMLAKGITGAVSKVTGAIKGVVGKVRDFLPFSPAKVGPLSDLDKLDFGGPIGDSIRHAIPEVTSLINDMVSLPDIEVGNTDVYSEADQTIINFERMFDGANINVEDEEDAVDVARELYRMASGAARSKGVKGV